MKYIFLTAIIFSGLAIAQNCIVPAPVAPPIPSDLVIHLPKDGGTVGCTITSIVPQGQPSNIYPIGNAKCAIAVGIAQQAAANDNGWNDGGVP